MPLRNVSKQIVTALRDACNKVLEDDGRCGGDDNFVIGVAIDDECAEISHVDLYAEFEVTPPHYEVPLREALQIVAKHIDYAAWDCGREIGDRLLASLKTDGESPLRWGKDDDQMKMHYEWKP